MATCDFGPVTVISGETLQFFVYNWIIYRYLHVAIHRLYILYIFTGYRVLYIHLFYIPFIYICISRFYLFIIFLTIMESGQVIFKFFSFSE